jgi:hypothetical protein
MGLVEQGANIGYAGPTPIRSQDHETTGSQNYGPLVRPHLQEPLRDGVFNMDALRQQFPTGLTDACEEFVNQTVVVDLRAGWGWNLSVDGQHQPIEDEETVRAGKLSVGVRSFFRGDVLPTGHKLDRLNAVLFTLSDGTDFDFRQNICMVWGAWFGDQHPRGPSGTIPEFHSGRFYRGYAAAYTDEREFKDCRRRLQALDPRRAKRE